MTRQQVSVVQEIGAGPPRRIVAIVIDENVPESVRSAQFVMNRPILVIRWAVGLGLEQQIIRYKPHPTGYWTI